MRKYVVSYEVVATGQLLIDASSRDQAEHLAKLRTPRKLDIQQSKVADISPAKRTYAARKR